MWAFDSTLVAGHVEEYVILMRLAPFGSRKKYGKTLISRTQFSEDCSNVRLSVGYLQGLGRMGGMGLGD